MTSKASHVFVVMVSVEAGPDDMRLIEAHAVLGLEQFTGFAGYLSGALHRSHDGRRIVQYLRWASEAHYRTCIESSIWDQFPSTKEFMSLVESGGATMRIETYRLLEESSGQKKQEIER